MINLTIIGDYVDYTCHRLTIAQYEYWNNVDPIFLDEYLYSDQEGSKAPTESLNFANTFADLGDVYKKKSVLLNGNFKIFSSTGDEIRLSGIRQNTINKVNNTSCVEINYGGSASMTVAIPTSSLNTELLEINYCIKDNLKIIDNIKYNNILVNSAITEYEITRRSIKLKGK